MDEDGLWAIIEQGRDGILGTIGRDGVPQLSNIYYLADRAAGLIRFSTTTDRVKGRNLLRDPRAAIHVPGRNFLNFAVVEGAVRLAPAERPGDPAVQELMQIHSALGAPVDERTFGEQMVTDRRMAVRLEVARIYGQVSDGEPRGRGA